MKKIIVILNFLLTFQVYSYELDEIYYFPKKERSEFTLGLSLKEFEIEYENVSTPLAGNDIEEFDQQVLIFSTTYKYSITNRFLIQAGLVYQGKDLDTYFEDISINKTPTKSKGGIFDPTIEFRYRFVKMNSVFLDALFSQKFKTNAYIEGNRNRGAKPYSGENISKITSEVGYKFRKLQLKTNLSIAFLSNIERKILLFEDTFKSEFTYAVGFAGTIVLRISQDYNLSGSFTSVSVNAYDMISFLNKLHVDKLLNAVTEAKVEYKGFEKSIGRLSLSFSIDSTRNRITYNGSEVITSKAKLILTTLGIKKRF